MLSNVQRIRTYAGIVVVIVLIAGFAFNFAAGRRLADVELLQEVKVFGTALERFKLDFARYPRGNGVDITRGVILSENGFDAGEKIYYRGRFDSPKPALYTSDGDTYTVTFSLRREWRDQGIRSKQCQIQENYVFSCFIET